MQHMIQILHYFLFLKVERTSMFFKQHGVHRKIDQTVSHKTKLKNESQKIQENPRKTQKKWSDKLQHQQITEKVFSNVPASTCLNLNLKFSLHQPQPSTYTSSYAVQFQPPAMQSSQPLNLSHTKWENNNLKGYYLQKWP